MNATIIEKTSKELNISKKQIEAVLSLLSDGATIPFIARYRKEATGNLNEEIIRSIDEVYQYGINLLKRKEDILRLIDEKGLLTPELINEINEANKLVEVEDIYRPFKEKKKTKATEAIKQGLEPLAMEIMSFPLNGDLKALANPYVKETVKNIDEALLGAGFIIAEMISDNALYRKWVRNYIKNNGFLITKVKKNHSDEKGIYEIYYNFKSKITLVKPYQVLAINRAESEKVITVSLDVPQEAIDEYFIKMIIKNSNSFVCEFVISAIKDSYKRLIFPSVEREIRSELKSMAEDQAIKVFGDNLEKLLLTPPIKNKVVLGFDPAFRTGCKLAVLDASGNLLKTAVIYPHEPKKEIEKSANELLKLINDYQIDIIAIGNGTASRESELFVANTIKRSPRKVNYVIVSEAGASVYSASKLAIEEFPHLHVEERSAVSIGRRLQDALNELVKIETKSIGVGQYQHDVNQKELDNMLGFVVTKVVNNVGVNVNNASKTILGHISGLNKTYIEKIYKLISCGQKIKNRHELSKILSPKVYEQAIGFLRINDGDNLLDKTDIHPESYQIVEELLNHLSLNLNDINKPEFKDAISNLNILNLAKELSTDQYTLIDIQKSLLKPGRDPRENYDAPILRSDVLTLDDLEIGMKLSGVVRNVIDFGAFVDIGLKNDGLVHISKMANKFIKHPSEVLSVGEIIEVTIIEVNKEKGKVGLSLL